MKPTCEFVIDYMNSNADKYMKFTLGNEKDEYNEDYAKVYQYEWRDCINDFSYMCSELHDNGYKLNSVGLSYMFIQSFSGVIIFEHKTLDIENINILMSHLIKLINNMI